MKIIIDNGHGENTPGKRSPIWSDGKQLFEYEFNRDIANRVCNALRMQGVDAELLVREYSDVSLEERVKRVNQIARANKCLLVSIHANAGGGTGWEIWTSVGQTKSDNYATEFCLEFEKMFPDRKLRKDTADGDPDKESNFYILKNTSCPAVLTENFFMDNESDCRYIMSAQGRREVSELHVNAILRCLKLK